MSRSESTRKEAGCTAGEGRCLTAAQQLAATAVQTTSGQPSAEGRELRRGHLQQSDRGGGQRQRDGCKLASNSGRSSDRLTLNASGPHHRPARTLHSHGQADDGSTFTLRSNMLAARQGQRDRGQAREAQHDASRRKEQQQPRAAAPSSGQAHSQAERVLPPRQHEQRSHSPTMPRPRRRGSSLPVPVHRRADHDHADGATQGAQTLRTARSIFVVSPLVQPLWASHKERGQSKPPSQNRFTRGLVVEAMERCGNRRPRVERLASAWNQGSGGVAESAGEPNDPLIAASAEPRRRARTQLTDEEVDAMRTARAQGVSVTTLARRFGVHRGTVWAKTRVGPDV